MLQDEKEDALIEQANSRLERFEREHLSGSIATAPRPIGTPAPVGRPDGHRGLAWPGLITVQQRADP